MRKDVEELLRIGEEDLEVAEKNFQLGFYRISAFLCQQAVERFLKAYLLCRIGKYPFTHSITKLLKICIEENPNFKELLDMEINVLEDYYTGTRYPPIIEVSREEAEEAIEIARKVRDFVKSNILKGE